MHFFGAQFLKHVYHFLLSIYLGIKCMCRRTPPSQLYLAMTHCFSKQRCSFTLPPAGYDGSHPFKILSTLGILRLIFIYPVVVKHLISQFAFPLLLIMLSSFSYVYVSFRFPILLRLLFLPITVLLGCLPHESSWQWQYPSHCELPSPTTFKHSEVGGWTQPSTEVNGTGRSCFAVSIINWGSSKSENKGSQAEELTHAY